MTKDEVLHLARLARISIRETEVAAFTKEIDAILAYVSEVADIATDTDATPSLTPVYNVFREDAVTNEPDQYTDTMLKAMPETDGRFMKVKKILHQNED